MHRSSFSSAQCGRPTRPVRRLPQAFTSLLLVVCRAQFRRVGFGVVCRGTKTALRGFRHSSVVHADGSPSDAMAMDVVKTTLNCKPHIHATLLACSSRPAMLWHVWTGPVPCADESGACAGSGRWQLGTGLSMHAMPEITTAFETST